MEEDGGNTGMAQVAGHMVALRVARAADDQALIQRDLHQKYAQAKLSVYFVSAVIIIPRAVPRETLKNNNRKNARKLLINCSFIKIHKKFYANGS